MKVKLLENMNLEELTDVYLCNKYGKDPVKCLDCQDHESCPAGKRAIELLNEMTGGDQNIPKWKKGVNANRNRARKKAEELSRMEDPVKYLVEVEGSTPHCAKERLRKYRENYPDLFPNAPVNTRSRSVNKRSSPIRPNKKDAERKADYEKAITYDKPANYYVEKYGLSYDAAWHRWKGAEQKFGTITEENNKEETVMDEISLEEFLKNHETEKTDEIEDPFDTDLYIPDYTKPEPEEHAGAIMVENPNDPLKAKYEKLIHEREELLTKIKRYDNALIAFETVMDIMAEQVNRDAGDF